MKPVQILMDEDLLDRLDREARRRRSDRSKLVREACRALLALARRRALEERHRRAYARHPQDPAEIADWETAQEWPPS